MSSKTAAVSVPKLKSAICARRSAKRRSASDESVTTSFGVSDISLSFTVRLASRRLSEHPGFHTRRRPLAVTANLSPDNLALGRPPHGGHVGVRTLLFPASFRPTQTSGLDCCPLFEAQIMRTRASTVAALVTSIAWVATADAQTAAGTDDVERPVAAFEASRALVDVPAVSSSTPAAEKDQGLTGSGADGIGLGAAFGQAIGFSIFQHVVRLREEKTRRELGGPFFADWFKSVSHLGGNWD